MARQLRIKFPGAFYHVTSRGNERKAILRSNNKLARQIKLHRCHKYSGKKLKEIGACFGCRNS